jgi:uncharacterized peroxidase-related enzyme
LAEHVKHNYNRANLTARQKALCKFAEMVTRAPGALSARHTETLRLHGLSDRDILDAVEVIAYFNYINRIADALGIDPEPEMQQAYERRQAGTEPR